MILEHAILAVKPGSEPDFEVAFGQARALISRQPGFIDLSLSRSLESPSEYVLLVHWESLEAHTLGFRQSEDYQLWKALLHHFYEPFPVVEQFAEV